MSPVRVRFPAPNDTDLKGRASGPFLHPRERPFCVRDLMKALPLILALFVPLFAGADVPIVLNVRDFGAAGDGVTDDYEAMRAAAAALCAAPAGSRLVYPPGTYLVDRYRVFRGPV